MCKLIKPEKQMEKLMDKQEEISFIEKQIKSLEDSIEFKEFSLKEDKYKLQLLQRDLQEKANG